MYTRSEKSQPGRRMCSTCSERNRDKVLLRERRGREIEKEGGRKEEKNRQKQKQTGKQRTDYSPWLLMTCQLLSPGMVWGLEFHKIPPYPYNKFPLLTHSNFNPPREMQRHQPSLEPPSSHNWERPNPCNKFFITHHLFLVCFSDTTPTVTWGSTIRPPVSCLTSPSSVICKEGKTIPSLQASLGNWRQSYM